MQLTPKMGKAALKMLPEHAKSTLGQVAEVADGAGRVGIVGAPDYLRPLFAQAADAHGVPPDLLEAMAAKLSGYRPNVAGGVLRVPPSIVQEARVHAEPAELIVRDPAAAEALRFGVDAAAGELARIHAGGVSWTEAVRDYLERVAEELELEGLVGDILEDVLGRFAVYLLRRLPDGYARALLDALEER